MVDELNTDINHVNNVSYIFVGRKANAKGLIMAWEYPLQVNWSKYQIKETDMRQKTMTFTSPQYFDLTDGQFCVLLVSALHENFGGIILSVDYDEGTGLYDYKCQDYSRLYQRKFETIGTPKSNHAYLMEIISHFAIDGHNIDKYVLAEWSKNLAGLRPAKDYDNSIWNNYIKGNPMNKTAQRIIRDKPAIEVIRNICFGEIGFVDVYFDEYGYLNIEPYNHEEWSNRGLHLSTSEVINRKFGFDTTNIITRVVVNGSNTNIGYALDSSDLLGLDLAAFFGVQATSIGSGNKTSETNNTTTKTTKTTKKSSTNDKKDKYANNMGTKKKQVWLSADGGTPRSVLNGIAKKLQKYGWTTHVNNNIGAGAHSRDIYKVKNGVYSPIYNGACAMTIKELWDGGAYRDAVRRGGVLAPIWWTSGWTDPHGMKPYRYGLENMKRLEKAWDDPSNYCPILYNPGKQMTKRNIRYCCAPTVNEIVAQFLAGGCVASKKNIDTKKK